MTIAALEILAVATLTVVARFLWQGRKGFNLWDEGFLWYGAQRIMQGEVPLRDFCSYDPGRYYWSAAFMRLRGHQGPIALRESVALLQALGITGALWLITSPALEASLPYLMITSIILAAWMHPWYRIADNVASILAVGSLAFLVQDPTLFRFFLSGVVLGFTAFLGRNHGGYGAAGTVAAMAWFALRGWGLAELLQGVLSWLVGLIVGFSPMLFMAIWFPDFGAAFVEGLLVMLKASRNGFLPLPTPWPWRVTYSSRPLGDSLREALVGLFFLGSVLFGVLSPVWVLWQTSRGSVVSPVLVAAAFLTLPYSHHSFSRADVDHLSVGIFPPLIGVLSLLSAQSAGPKWFLVLALTAATFWVLRSYQPGWQCTSSGGWVETEIFGDVLTIDPGTASEVELVRSLVGQWAPAGRSFVTVPFWPGAYAAFGRRAPVWDIFPLLPRSRAFEEAEIERIARARPCFVLVMDLALDGLDERRFRNTHPETYRFFEERFERLSGPWPPMYEVFRPKSDDA